MAKYEMPKKNFKFTTHYLPVQQTTIKIYTFKYL